MFAGTNWEKYKLIDLKSSLIDKIAQYFPNILILSIFAGFIMAFVLHRPDFAIRGLVVGIPAILAAYFLIKTRNFQGLDNTIELFLLQRFPLKGLFILIYLISIIAVILSPFRPWYYFVLIAILFSLTAIQIFSRNFHPNFILIEICLIMINLSYLITLNYPFYFAWTDIFSHIHMAEVILRSGHIIPPDLDISYANFPLYHLSLSENSILIGLDIKTILFSVMIIPYIITILFIYFIFRKITQNIQLSLLVCLLYSSLSVVIFYSTYVITRVFAYVAFIILFYVLLKETTSLKYKFQYRLLFFIVVTYIILVHQVSVFQIIFLLILLLISEFFTNNIKIVKISFLVIICVMVLSYWRYIASDFFQILLSTRSNSISSDGVMVMKSSVQAGNEWYFIFSNMDMIVLIFFVLCGIGYLLITYKKQNILTYALFGLLTLPLFIPNPLQVLWTSMVLFRTDRIMLLLAPFFAFLMAIGIYIIINYLKKKNLSKRGCGVVLILIFLIFPMLSMTLTNASDSYEFNLNRPRLHFNEGEVQGINYAFSNIPSGSDLSSDYYVDEYFGSYRKFNGSDNLGLPYYLINNPDNFGSIVLKDGYLIFREREFQKDGLIFLSQDSRNTYKLDMNTENMAMINSIVSSNNKIYNNKDITVSNKSKSSGSNVMEQVHII